MTHLLEEIFGFQHLKYKKKKHKYKNINGHEDRKSVICGHDLISLL